MKRHPQPSRWVLASPATTDKCVRAGSAKGKAVATNPDVVRQRNALAIVIWYPFADVTAKHFAHPATVPKNGTWRGAAAHDPQGFGSEQNGFARERWCHSWRGLEREKCAHETSANVACGMRRNRFSAIHLPWLYTCGFVFCPSPRRAKPAGAPNPRTSAGRNTDKTGFSPEPARTGNK